MKVELATLQTQLDATQSSREQESTALREQIERLTGERDRLSETTHMSDLRCREMDNRCVHLQSQLTGKEKDLLEYKQKATTVLQTKEKLILGLQEELSTQSTAYKV